MFILEHNSRFNTEARFEHGKNDMRVQQEEYILFIYPLFIAVDLLHYFNTSALVTVECFLRCAAV